MHWFFFAGNPIKEYNKMQYFHVRRLNGLRAGSMQFKKKIITKTKPIGDFMAIPQTAALQLSFTILSLSSSSNVIDKMDAPNIQRNILMVYCECNHCRARTTFFHSISFDLWHLFHCNLIQYSKWSFIIQSQCNKI